MPNKVVALKGLPRNEWLEHRRKGLGGSDAATLFGLNPFSSLFSLYCDKKGLLPDQEDTEVQRQGRDLEDYVARRWMEATGKKVRRSVWMYQHETIPYMLADIDREVVGENAGLECKTTSLYNRCDFEGGEIPPYYYVQCLWYMAVKGFDRMYLAVLVLSGGFYHFVIERDGTVADEIKEIEKRAVDFWENHVLAGNPPEPDGSEASEAAIKVAYAADVAPPKTVMLHGREDEIQRYIQLGDTIKGLEKEQQSIKEALQVEMGASAYGVAQGYKVTWKAHERRTVDTALLKEKYPDAYKECAKITNARPFKVAKIREE